MTETLNRQWRLVNRPTGMVTEKHFARHEEPCPTCDDGSFLIRTLYVSVDPAMRGWITEDPDYMPPVPLNSVMLAPALGQVIESKHLDFKVGDIVSGMLGWQDYCLSDGNNLAPVQRVTVVHPLPRYLGVLGGTGLTAYFGLLDIGRPRENDVVVVSGAAGATGSVAAQIAKIKQCHVIGIAGGQEKCNWLATELGLDATIDYKTENVEARLAKLCPKGINVYFDNVGGPLLEIVLAQMATWGRIALCGMISGYNADKLVPGPSNMFRLITRRIRMEGFLVPDYGPRFKDARREMSAWLATGTLKAHEDIREGFDVIPQTFCGLFQGTNTGKLMVKLSEPTTTS